jgi:hypothetical protein
MGAVSGGGSTADLDLFHSFRDQLIGMLLELLRVAIVMVQGAQQIANPLQLPLHPNEVREVLRAALDRTKLESRVRCIDRSPTALSSTHIAHSPLFLQGLKYSSQAGASGNDQEIISNVAKKLRDLIR